MVGSAFTTVKVVRPSEKVTLSAADLGRLLAAAAIVAGQDAPRQTAEPSSDWRPRSVSNIDTGTTLAATLIDQGMLAVEAPRWQPLGRWGRRVPG